MFGNINIKLLNIILINLLVVSHPDDEILGFGGTGHKLCSKGEIVQPVILCGQVLARKQKPIDNDLINDIRKANDYLGFNFPILGDFPNLKFNNVPHIELVQFIEKQIIQTQPDRIFTHFPNDLNDDHRKVSNACQVAAKLSQRNPLFKPIKGLYFMEILSSTEWSNNQSNLSFNPNIFIDISSSIDKKIKALSYYRNVMREPPHPRSDSVIRSLSIYRGSQIGFKNAEAFQVCFQRNLS